MTCDADAVPDPVRRARALWLNAYGRFSAGDPGRQPRAQHARAHPLRGRGRAVGASPPRSACGRRSPWSAATWTAWPATGSAAGPSSATSATGGANCRPSHRWPRSPRSGGVRAGGAPPARGLQIARELSLEAESVGPAVRARPARAATPRTSTAPATPHEQARRIAVEQGYQVRRDPRRHGPGPRRAARR
ncbi:hypothetical protein LT493_40545 [Streptomyces tricolor]|nr:hypothetical protein [Streptomyces tricolor]